MDRDVQMLVVRLLSQRFVPRDDMLVRKALTNEAFRQELDRRLTACGLRLQEHPYSDHVAVVLLREAEEAAFAQKDAWLSNNAGLPRDAVALLVVLWAMLILPKRQRQVQRVEAVSTQDDMFREAKPIPRGDEVAEVVSERTLITEFGEKLGKATRLKTNLAVLARLGFIKRRDGDIREGPLLDLVFSYNEIAPRLIDGVLSDLVSKRHRAHTIEIVRNLEETRAAEAFVNESPEESELDANAQGED